MGGEAAQTEERRGVEKAVQTEERREVEKEVTAVQTVQRVKKEHPLPPMEEWLPRTRVKKIDALNGRLVERPEPCSSSSSSSSSCTTTTTTTTSSSAPPPPPPPRKKRPPSGVRCTIATPHGVPVDSLFGQVPKALPRWQRHQPKALIQVSCPHLNSLMQRKASSVPTSRAPTRGVDLVMEFRLMAAVTPWIGHLLLPPPRTRRRSSTDRLRQRGEELHLSSTSVFLLLLKTLRVDLTGCMGAIEQRTGGNRSSSPRADSLCALSPKREPSPKMTIPESELLSFIRLTKPRQHVQQLVVPQQQLLQEHKQQRVKYLLQQERQQKQQRQLVQAHTSRQQEVSPRQPRPQSPQPHHLQLVLTQQPKKSNTPPPPVSPWMIPHPVPPHILMPIPPNMLLQYLPLMRPAVLRAQMPPLPFPLRSVPQTCQPLAVSMSSATPVSMSSSGPVSMSTNTPVTMSNTPVSKSSNTPVFVSTSTPVSMPSHTPVTMSNTPVFVSTSSPVSMPSHTPVTMSNTPVFVSTSTPVSMSCHTPVTMSNTPVTMPSNAPVSMPSHTPVTMSSNPPVSMPSPTAVKAVPLPHNPSAIPLSLPNSSSVSRASAPTVPGQPSASSETTSQCHSHASSPAEEKPSGKRDRPDGMITSPGEACESGKRQRKLTEKVKLLQDDAVAKVDAKAKKMVTPKRKKQKIVQHAPDMLPKGQSLWKMTVDGLVQVTAGDELPPGLKLPLPPIGGRPTPPRNVVFQQLIPLPNSSTNKIQASPRPHASPTSVPPRSASSPLLPALLPGINHPGLLVFPGVLPPPGGTSSPGPSGSSFLPRPTTPTTGVRPQAVSSSSSSSLPVGSRPAINDHRVGHQTSGSPRGPPPPGPSPGPTALPTGSPFQPRLPPSLSQPRPPAGPPSFTLLHPGPPSLPRLPSPPISSVRVPFKGTANAAAAAAAPGTPPRTPPLLRIEPTQVDPSLMFTEPVAEVQRWMSGCRGVAVPGSDLALPYLPPFISNLRTLCALLKAKRSLVDRALQSEPVGDSKPSSPRPGPSPAATTPGRFPDHDYIQTSHPEEDERVAAVRHLVAQRFAANPAYQLLKARFLSCFTVPALLATVEPIIHLPDSCTANEEEEELRVLEAEEELRAGEAEEEELRVGEAEEELRGGEAEEELRVGEEENVGSENPLLLMRGSPAAHYSGMTTRLTSRLLATEPSQTGPMDTGPEQ